VVVNSVSDRVNSVSDRVNSVSDRVNDRVPFPVNSQLFVNSDVVVNIALLLVRPFFLSSKWSTCCQHQKEIRCVYHTYFHEMVTLDFAFTNGCDTGADGAHKP
jgi:hypothetical protein